MEKRITNRDWTKAEIQDDKKSVSWGYRHIRLKKLWELENGLEGGTVVLVKLPCSIGTTIYYCSNSLIFTFTFNSYKITNKKVFLYFKGIEGQSFTRLELEADRNGNINSDRVFFTHEEAEKKLEELNKTR